MQKIRLYKNRSFGEIIDATFGYFRQHFKPLMRVHFRISVPMGLAMILLTIAVQMGIGFDFQSIFEPDSMPIYLQSSDYMISTVISTIASFIFYITLFLVTASYIYLNEQQEDDQEPVTSAMVWQEFGKHFWMSLLAMLLYALAIGIGLVILFIPGIYFFVRMSLYQSAIVFERKDSSSALSRSGELIRENWWFTFGIIIVLLFISSILVSIINAPILIFTFITTINAVQDPETISSINPTTFLWWTIGSYVLSYLGSLFAYTITQIGSTMLYGKFVEIQEGRGLLQTIDSAVSTETDQS